MHGHQCVMVVMKTFQIQIVPLCIPKTQSKMNGTARENFKY